MVLLDCDDVVNMTGTFHFDRKGLEELKGTWDLLAQLDHNQDFYKIWNWIDCCNRYLTSQQPLIIYEKHHAQLGRCLIPLERTEQRILGQTIRVIRLPYHEHIDLSGIITESNDNYGLESLLVALVNDLKQQKIQWDLLSFNHFLFPVDEGKLRENFGFRTICKKLTTSNYLDIKSPLSYENQVPRKFRKNLSRLRRRACELGKVECQFVSDKNDLERAFEQFLEVEASGWKGAEGALSAIKFDKNLVGFYRELMSVFAANNRMQINVLSIDKKVAAAQFCLKACRKIYILKIGFNEEFSRFAPGNLLIESLVQNHLLDEYVDEISFVTGPPWSSRWHAKERDVYSINLFNNTLKGKAVYSAYKAKNLLLDKNH